MLGGTWNATEDPEVAVGLPRLEGDRLRGWVRQLIAPGAPTTQSSLKLPPRVSSGFLWDQVLAPMRRSADPSQCT